MVEKIEKIISQNLIELRKSRNLKQSELSEQIGYSDKTISRWENGTSVPDVVTLVKLSEFYGVSLEDLTRENAIDKTEVEEGTDKEKIMGEIAMTILSVMASWGLFVLVYIGLYLFQRINMWQLFIWAIPVSSIFAYRITRKDYGLKWLNFTFLTMTVLGLALAGYLQFLEYNFWQVFFMIIPLEGMVVVTTLFPKSWRESYRKVNKVNGEKSKKAKKEKE